jgi:hypothetical protein
MPTRLRPEEVVTIAVLDEKGKFVAETRTKLAQMTEQRDQVRSKLSLDEGELREFAFQFIEFCWQQESVIWPQWHEPFKDRSYNQRPKAK